MIKETLPGLSLLNNEELKLKLVAPILAGMFEVSGGVRFETMVTRKNLTHTGPQEYEYSYPLVSYGDNDPKKTLRLRQLFGGSCVRGSADTWSWVMVGAKAFIVGRHIFDYSPSRKPILGGFEQWGSLDVRDRLTFVKEFNNSEGYLAHVAAEDYKDLVKNPLFLVGVYIGRGVTSDSDDRRVQVIPEDGNFKIGFNSVNRPLLEAVTSLYPGGCWLEPRYSETLQSERSRIFGQVPSRAVLARNSANRFYSDIAQGLGWFLHS